VLEIDPKAPVAANNLAWIYAASGENLDVALQLAQTAQRHLPELAAVNDTLGFIYYRKNLPALAIPMLSMSARKEPANAIYQYHLGLALAGGGERARARQALTRALVLKPGFEGAAQARAMLTSLEK
jgi:tetratricopeptide (TPR) repeat protein